MSASSAGRRNDRRCFAALCRRRTGVGAADPRRRGRDRANAQAASAFGRGDGAGGIVPAVDSAGIGRRGDRPDDPGPGCRRGRASRWRRGLVRRDRREYGVFGGYLPPDAAHQIYGSDPLVITGGAFRPTGQAVVVDGGYRVTGRWPLGSGCQHSAWIVGGCRIFDGDQPRLGADGLPVMRLLFFPAASCEILDTWHSIGLRGTGSHDYAVTDLFVPAAHSLWFREPPVEPGPLYAMPTIALFGAAIAAVPLGIGRHAIDILTKLAESKTASRSRRTLSEDSALQGALGRA